MPAYDFYTWDDLLIWSDTEVFADIATDSVESVGEAPVVSFVAGGGMQPYDTVYVPAFSGITADYDFTDVIPAGYMLDKIVVQNNVVGAATLDIGTTAAGSEIVSGLGVAGSGWEVVSNAKYFGMTTPTTIYINNLSASANITVALVLIRIYNT